MLLIADSGSTKTDWHFVDKDEVVTTTQTSGLNPYFYTSADILQILNEEWGKEIIPGQVEKVFFYGAGASSKQRQQVVEKALADFFPEATVTVYHDLLGAARALCGDTAGIVSILGTGSNSCFYDGTGIVSQRGGHGYILSDEGSGNHMGRLLVNDYLNDDVPGDLKENLEATYRLDCDVVIHAIYEDDNPSRYLAAFAEFLGEHLDHSYARQLVKYCFKRFLKAHVVKYPGYREHAFHAVGSVADAFAGVLAEVVQEQEMKMGNILKAPIEALVRFHVKQEKQAK